MMVISGVISAIFVGLSIILIFIRLMFDLRFTAVQQEPDQTPLFRRKVNHLRKIEQSRHIRYLLIACLMIGIGTVIIMGSFLILADKQQKMTVQNQKANQRIARLEKQQKELIKSTPLKNYPENGIGLKEYEWDKLVGENKDLKLQKQTEIAISQRSGPYFSSFDTKVSFSEPKTLILQLKAWTDNDTSGETIKKNIDSFVKEAEEIPELMAIHVQLITSSEKNEKVVYSVTYAREKSEDTFNKQNVSEQNLKNDGGKG
ncbi:hypothetical protein [Enterococcus sp.]|uniref:hypothetical protein n=1 Tax=Enterococcus sp. TaxID=35783 RepID=UPI002909B737|nr:hypothetical protein [Enterococcus sp.]MDU5334648.1 hypothetical protein [Enterococcus sp.]